MSGRRLGIVVLAVVTSLSLFGMASAAGDAGSNGAPPADPFSYWTPERVASAVPRDLVIDHRGLGYLRGVDGSLTPYGHGVAAEARPLSVVPASGAVDRPSRSSDVVAQSQHIGTMSPAAGDTIGASWTFSVQLSAPTGIKNVNAFVGRVGSSPQRFQMSYAGTDGGYEVWEVTLQGFGNGEWQWYVEARDNAPRGGNRLTSEVVPFTVGTGGGGGTITNQRWTGGGTVQAAAGRVLFVMGGTSYVCSGTAVSDSASGRSIILTAAHCVYDDVAKAFASSAIFIPNQDDGGSDRTDSNCTNDPYGCWSVDHGVVDVNWTTRTFPDNIAWDYGYYVVADSGAHSGTGSESALDQAVGSLPVSFSSPSVGQTATALGYSYSYDPNFMYCQEAMGTNGAANYWLDSCDLSGGSSGGPWLQPLNGGNGPIMSVNSWGYSMWPGMAGPKLHDNSAQLLFDVAKSTDLTTTDRGFVVDPTAPPPTTTTTAPTTTTVPPPTTTTTTAPTTTTVPPPTTTTTVAESITLVVDNFKVRGEKIANLIWTGTPGSGQVDIYRDGLNVYTTADNGSYEDRTGMSGGGTNSWQVCIAGSTSPEDCSPVVTVGW